MKIHPGSLSVPAAQRADKKISELILFIPHHGECCVEKLRQYNKIYRNIILSRRQDLLNCILIQEKEVPLLGKIRLLK